MLHELKTYTRYFKAIKEGRKTFEIRKNDRCFQVGDILTLKSYSKAMQKYMGEEINVRIIYILNDPDFLLDGYVCMSIQLVQKG